MGEEEVKKKRNMVLIVLVLCALLFFACTIAINSSLNEIEPLKLNYNTENILQGKPNGNINLVIMPKETSDGVTK